MKSNQTLNPTLNPICAAVEPFRAEAIARAEAAARAYVATTAAALEAAGFDANKIAPHPDSNSSRVSYQMAKAKRERLDSLTDDANAKSDVALDSRVSWQRRRNQVADIRKINAAKVEAFVEMTKRDADAGFDGYIIKLTGKIVTPAAPAVVTDCKVVGGAGLWSYSILEVTRATGIESWKTQMILNVSVLGKLFNQWPTRRVK